MAIILAVTWGVNLPFSEMMGEPTSGPAAALSLVSRSLPLSAPPGPLRPVHPRYNEKNGGKKEVNSRIPPLVAIIYHDHLPIGRLEPWEFGVRHRLWIFGCGAMKLTLFHPPHPPWMMTSIPANRDFFGPVELQLYTFIIFYQGILVDPGVPFWETLIGLKLEHGESSGSICQ